MSRTRVFVLTSLAMIAFAGNSLLCRLALNQTGIDAASFTSIRIVSGALALWLIVLVRGGTGSTSGSWPSAFALFVYAAAFSFAYLSLPAAAGALLLFGAVQARMIICGLWAGERLRWRQSSGLIFAFGGLVGLLLPGLSAPPLYGSLLMLAAGVAWGIYSLRGKGTGDPTRVTAGNFLRAVSFAAGVRLALLSLGVVGVSGVLEAVLLGGIGFGVGFVLLYHAVRGVKCD